jgi:hypothetical protein
VRSLATAYQHHIQHHLKANTVVLVTTATTATAAAAVFDNH